MILPGIDACVFDFDGTLCDTDPDIRGAWRMALKRLNLDCPRFDAVFRTGPGLNEMSELLFPGADAAFLTALRAEFRNCYDNSELPLSRVFPGVDAWLDELAAAGTRLFIATHKRAKPLARLIRRFGWSGRFAAVYDGTMPPHGVSPKEWMLTNAVAGFKLSPGRSAMIGDTAPDLRAGRRCGFVTVAVEWGYGTVEELTAERPDYILKAADLSRKKP